MNWIILDIAVLIVVFACVGWGWSRGFITTVIVLVGSLFSFWIASTIAEPTSQWVYENLAQEHLVGYVQERLDNLNGGSQMDELTAMLVGLSQMAEPISGIADISQALQRLMGIPQTDAVQVSTDNLQDSLAVLLSTGQSVAEGLVEVTLRPVVMLVLRMGIMLVSFILLMGIFRVIAGLSGIFNKIPVIGSINRFMGGMVGIVQAYIVLLLLTIALGLFLAATGNDGFITTATIDQTMLFSRIPFPFM